MINLEQHFAPQQLDIHEPFKRGRGKTGMWHIISGHNIRTFSPTFLNPIVLFPGLPLSNFEFPSEKAKIT